MSEIPDTSNDANDTADTAGFTPPATQADLNKIIRERLDRERGKFADYNDLKAKAAKFDEVEAASQSELEKANNRATAAERERDDARAEGLRLRVAAKHGISDEDADLFLTGTDEETLTKQAQRLTDREADRKKQGNFSPREGTTSTSVDTDERQVARALFGG